MNINKKKKIFFLADKYLLILFIIILSTIEVINYDLPKEEIYSYLGIVVVWGILLCILFSLVLLDNKKTDNCDFDAYYYKDVPFEYGPEVVEYLIKRKVTYESFGAALLNLIRKGFIKVKSDDKNDTNYIFTKINASKKKLSSSDVYLEKILFDMIGDGKSVDLASIKSYGLKVEPAEELIDAFYSWESEVVSLAKKQEFYRKRPFIYKCTVLYCIFSLIITFTIGVVGSNFFFFVLSWLPSALVLFFISKFKHKTSKGTLHYKKWIAFKNFLHDFEKFDLKELPNIKDWDKYLIYAISLDCLQELECSMEKLLSKIKNKKEIDFLNSIKTISNACNYSFNNCEISIDVGSTKVFPWDNIYK